MKYRLTAVHLINDKLVPEGTIVGDETEYQISGPSMFMEPLDDEAKVAYEKRMERWHGRRPPAEILLPPTSVAPGQRVPGTGPLPPKVATTQPKAGPSGFPVGTPVKGD